MTSPLCCKFAATKCCLLSAVAPLIAEEGPPAAVAGAASPAAGLLDSDPPQMTMPGPTAKCALRMCI